MGRPQPTYSSADMVRDLIDESRAWPRYETVHGERLVTPARRVAHQRIAFRLARRIADHLDREPVGEAFMSSAGISWGPPDVLVQPDVFVIPPESSRAATRRDRAVRRHAH